MKDRICSGYLLCTKQILDQMCFSWSTLKKMQKNNEKCNLAKEKKGGTWDSSLSKSFRWFFPDFPISSNSWTQVTIAPNQITFSSMLPMIPSYNWPLVLDLCSLSRCRDIGMDRVNFDAAIRITWGRGQDGTFGDVEDDCFCLWGWDNGLVPWRVLVDVGSKI